MKTSRAFTCPLGLSSTRAIAAYTMGEMMVTMGVFMLMMAGTLYAYLFGLNLYETSKIKLGASDDARNGVIHLTDTIRSATKIKVGSGNLTNFTEVATNAVQSGNSIQVYPTTNTTTFYRYFYDTNRNSSTFTKLLMTTNGTTWDLVIANSITNNVDVFTSEDAFGNVLTNNLNNRVIGVRMQFFQIQYPIVSIGPTNYYHFYQLRTKVTRRTLY